MLSSKQPPPSLQTSALFPLGLASVLLIVVTLAYCVQVASPLRINTDAYRLLSMAASASESQGYLVDGQPDQFPIGYPFLVKVMLSAGVANSASLVALNLLFYGSGFCLLWHWTTSISDRSITLIAVLWAASSWVLVKHATLPLSDSGYFALSLAALHCLLQFFKSPLPISWPWFFAAIGLILLSLQFRTVGIALLPSAAASVVFHSSLHPFWRGCGKHKARIAWGLSVVSFVGSVSCIWVLRSEWFSSQFLATGSYFQTMLGNFEQQGMLGFLLRNLGFRVLEMGEIALNCPESKALVGRPAFYLAGVAGWVLVAVGCVWLCKRNFLPLVAYMVFYFCLMVTWPHYDTRFWIPVLPVFSIALWGWLSDVARDRKLVRLGAAGALGGHILLGLLALSFSTRISVAGDRVSEFFGEETTRMTYREALQNGLPVDAALVHAGKVRILRVFEPMARFPKAERSSE